MEGRCGWEVVRRAPQMILSVGDVSRGTRTPTQLLFSLTDRATFGLQPPRLLRTTGTVSGSRSTSRNADDASSCKEVAKTAALLTHYENPVKYTKND